MPDMIKWVAITLLVGGFAIDHFAWSWTPDWMPGSLLFLLVSLIALIILGAVFGKIGSISEDLGKAASQQPLKGILLAVLFSGMYAGILGVAFWWGIPYFQEQTMLPYRYAWVLGTILSLFAIPPLVLAYKMTGIPWEEGTLRRAAQGIAVLILVGFAISVYEKPVDAFSIDGKPRYMVAEDEGKIYPIDPEQCTDQDPCYSPATREKLRPATPADIRKYGTDPRAMEAVEGIWDAAVDLLGAIPLLESEGKREQKVALIVVTFVIFALWITRGEKLSGRLYNMIQLSIICGMVYLFFWFVTDHPISGRSAQQKDTAAVRTAVATTKSTKKKQTAPKKVKVREVSCPVDMGGDWKIDIPGQGNSTGSLAVLENGFCLKSRGPRGYFVVRGDFTEKPCGDGEWAYENPTNPSQQGAFTFCVTKYGTVEGKMWGDKKGRRDASTFTIAES